METEMKNLRPVELWILLILKAGGGEVCCKAKIMKILFLLERVYGIIGVKFRPYDYGPWSKEVEGALERLVELGLVEERELQKPPEGPEHTGLMYVYLLTKMHRAVETWSKDIEDVLRRLVELGLVEERERVYRLTEKGRSVVEKIPLKDPRWRLPYADVKFFVGWDVRDLMEYIYVNYPEYIVFHIYVNYPEHNVFQILSRMIRQSVIKDKLARKPTV